MFRKPSAAASVRREVANRLVGEPFSVASLLSLGPRPGVERELARLVEKGVLTHLVHGLYARPRFNPLVGPVPPTPASIVAAIAAATSSIVEPGGAEAAHRLGLTQQMPMKSVYLTSGRSRRVRLGATEISLRHAAPRKLALAGRPAGLALSAFWHLGKAGLTTKHVETARRHLPATEFAALVGAARLMPEWMRTIVANAEETLPAKGSVHG